MATEGGFFDRAVGRFFRDYLAAMGSRSPYSALIRRAMREPGTRKQLLNNPREVLADAGVKLPDGFAVEVLENTPTVINLVLPPMVGNAAADGGDA